MNVWGRLARIAADVVFGVVFAAALGFEAARIATSWGAGYWQFDLAVGAVVCGIALVGRRDPARPAVAALAVAAVAVVVVGFTGWPGEPGPAMALALSVLVAAAVRTLPPLPATGVAVGGLGVAAGSLLTAHGSPLHSGVVLANGLGWLLAVATGLALRLRRIRRLAVIDQVRRDERLELARELHDVVAHHITGVVVQAQAARIARRRHPEQLDEALADIETASSEALAAMRRVVGLLRHAGDAAPAGTEHLSDLVARFARHGPAVSLQLPEDQSEWPYEITSTVHRVVREALTNVVRHAPNAGRATVQVSQEPGHVAVEVADDAPAPAMRHRGGYGLIGLRERVEALGGTLTAGPGPERGWSVVARLPVPAGRR
ncbi:sensor histidine kinase [Kutzneria sp. 744]|uniref:sensor histidine kinase n=1 Tax=Kutzneria sp. (strain 744) TaxID=345341 RepID=UPI0003EEC2FA|nr:histidine kinase [Kutzneria sp. 744]EWM18919.1 two-component system sensor kinase [Kutzneria sp. 744]